MNKQTELLQNSLPLIGAGLGDKLGVRITVSGNQAWTDGKTINVPAFNISSKDEKNAVLGFMSHEAAHIKFDSFKGIMHHELRNPLQKAFWNIFEDLRIEKNMIQSMIGTKKWINQIWINRQNEGKRQPVTSKSKPESIITDYLLFLCRVKHRKQDHLIPYLDAAEDAFIDTFGWRLLTKLQAVLNGRLDSLSSSVDAMDLSKDVLKLLHDHEPEEEKDDDSNEQSGGEPSAEDIRQAIESALNSNGDALKDDMDDFIASLETLAKANDAVKTIGMPKSIQAINHNSVNNLSNELHKKVKQTSNALTAKLQGLVQQEMRVKKKTTKSGKTLNNKVISRYAVGDGRLFTSTQQKQSIDTIVEIALDNSASMTHSNLMDTAKEAQYALALALNRINGVAVTASAFPFDSEWSDDVIGLLQEGEHVENLANRVSFYCTGNGNHTPSGSAMWHCLRTVLNSKKKKKVILFITDGKPSGDDQAVTLENLVKKAGDSEITVIGIAIGSVVHNKAEFLRYFKHALFISDIRDLKKELFKVARNILTV